MVGVSRRRVYSVACATGHRQVVERRLRTIGPTYPVGHAVFLVATRQGLDDVFDGVRQGVGGDGDLLVMELGGPIAGEMPGSFWEWWDEWVGR